MTLLFPPPYHALFLSLPYAVFLVWRNGKRRRPSHCACRQGAICCRAPIAKTAAMTPLSTPKPAVAIPVALVYAALGMRLR